MADNTSSISLLLIWIGDDGRNSINCAFRTSDKLGSFSLTCKCCKYRLGTDLGTALVVMLLTHNLTSLTVTLFEWKLQLTPSRLG